MARGTRSNTTKTACGYCRGAGRDRFGVLSPLSRCSVCGGSGVVEIGTPFHRCAFCGGSGVHPHERLSCTACMGKGVIHVEEPVEKCAACQGSGHDAASDGRLFCTACNGAGVVPASLKNAGG